MGGPENAFIEAGGQRDAAIEGALTNAREASRQLDRRHRGAEREGARTDAHEAGGQRDRSHRGIDVIEEQP